MKTATKDLLKQEEKLYEYFSNTLTDEELEMLNDLLEISIEIENRCNE